MFEHGLFTWIVIGLVAGALAGRVTRGDGYGCCLSVVVGLAGALVGGSILRGTAGDSALYRNGALLSVLADIAVSFIGAVILLIVVRILFDDRAGRPRGLTRR